MENKDLNAMSAIAFGENYPHQMRSHNPLQYLPSAEDLPDSDDTPVDNELQILVANLLGEILAWVWRTRTDWFFGVNMGVYYAPDEPAIVPDGFLSLGVERLPRAGGRLSYVIWAENNVVPLLAVEFVSKTYGKEYDDKKSKYAEIGVLYYVVYNPDYWKQNKHQPFEVYRLVNGVYVQQKQEPLWIPEIGLGIGRGRGTYRAWTREWLYWYDQQGNQLLTPEEVALREQQRVEIEQQRVEIERQRAEQALGQLEQEQQRTAQEQQRAEQALEQLEQERQRVEQERRLREELLARLRERGIDPDAL